VVQEILASLLAPLRSFDGAKTRLHLCIAGVQQAIESGMHRGPLVQEVITRLLMPVSEEQLELCLTSLLLLTVFEEHYWRAEILEAERLGYCPMEEEIAAGTYKVPYITVSGNHGVTQKCLDMLSLGSEQVRAAALDLLAKSALKGNQSILERLVEMLQNDQSETVRQHVVYAIQSMASIRQVLRVLPDAIKKESGSVLYVAARALGSTLGYIHENLRANNTIHGYIESLEGYRGGVAFLDSMLDHCDPSHYPLGAIGVTHGLGRAGIKDDRAIKVLLQAARFSLRAHRLAIEALADASKTGDPVVKRFLIDTIHSTAVPSYQIDDGYSYTNVRLSAIDALGQVSGRVDKSVVECLLSCLECDKKSIRYRAANALAKVGTSLALDGLLNKLRTTAFPRDVEAAAIAICYLDEEYEHQPAELKEQNERFRRDEELQNILARSFTTKGKLRNMLRQFEKERLLKRLGSLTHLKNPISSMSGSLQTLK